MASSLESRIAELEAQLAVGPHGLAAMVRAYANGPERVAAALAELARARNGRPIPARDQQRAAHVAKQMQLFADEADACTHAAVAA